MPTIKRYIPLVLAGLVSACLQLPEIDTSPPVTPTQPDAGAVDTPDSGTPVTDLSVTITAPTGTFYTSGSVAISVDVRGGAPELVQLFKNTEELATLSSPYTYNWNTAATPEGSYTLTARATKSGRTFTSTPVTVIVDRTNLQVASRSPAPGSTNVAYSTPIQVVFSKPVKAATISDTTVSFAVAGVLAEKTFSLSSDGRTLTIAPKAKPPLPATFSIGLSSGITDSAGNALVVPTTPWSFELPHWHSFGGPLNAVGGNTLLKDTAIALDGQDNPVVAWSEELTAGGRASIYVYHWDGNAFTPVGSALNGTSNGSAYKPALVLDSSGNPIVAWQESDGFNENIYIRRWTGTTWQSVGAGAISAVNDTGSSPVATPARNPSLAVRGNNLYVAWDEMNVEGFSAIYVWKSVNGGAFTSAGASGGRVHAVGGFTSATKPSLVLDSNSQPIVAFQEQTLEEHYPTNIYVMRLQQDGSWVYAVPPAQGDPSNPPVVSGGLSASPGGDTWARDCSLTIDAQNNLYLAWTEESYIDGPKDIQVFRSTGPQAWERNGSPLSAYDGYSTPTGQARIQSTPAGKLFVTWTEFDGIAETGYVHLFASYWDNKSWNSINKEDGMNQNQVSSAQPALALDSIGRPVIVWHEGRNAGGSGTGEYAYVKHYNE
ncbi:Ig-like domain-containing protein [Archangium lansingense]|uniref:Ig-like domain-containing protein n=1 Tax=Archangium lansingense TaxID=2995310 RepID=A0ABT4AFD8_9BACT|nr:Ig-like domain-containing protein [Archangium lansinium]MCY1079879.1 Ig-like domain-containing protein [Archangium lansinium]